MIAWALVGVDAVLEHLYAAGEGRWQVGRGNGSGSGVRLVVPKARMLLAGLGMRACSFGRPARTRKRRKRAKRW